MISCKENCSLVILQLDYNSIRDIDLAILNAIILYRLQIIHICNYEDKILKILKEVFEK